MPAVFEVQSTVMLLLWLVLLAVKLFAFVSALTWGREAYRAADKLSKPAWSIILGLGVAFQVLLGSPVNLVNLVFTIAALVYLADVRPAMGSLTRR